MELYWFPCRGSLNWWITALPLLPAETKYSLSLSSHPGQSVPLGNMIKDSIPCRFNETLCFRIFTLTPKNIKLILEGHRKNAKIPQKQEWSSQLFCWINPTCLEHCLYLNCKKKKKEKTLQTTTSKLQLVHHFLHIVYQEQW